MKKAAFLLVFATLFIAMVIPATVVADPITYGWWIGYNGKESVHFYVGTNRTGMPSVTDLRLVTVMQCPVATIFGHEFLMSAGFHNLPADVEEVKGRIQADLEWSALGNDTDVAFEFLSSSQATVDAHLLMAVVGKSRPKYCQGSTRFVAYPTSGPLPPIATTDVGLEVNPEQIYITISPAGIVPAKG